MGADKRKKLAGQIRHLATAVGGVLAARAGMQYDLDKGVVEAMEPLIIEGLAGVGLIVLGQALSWFAPEKRS